MGPDLRTSARDLLTLAQKVSTVLQRNIDKLSKEIESSKVSSESEKTFLLEQSQGAIDIRRQVLEASKQLKDALEHIEDIEDENEPQILRESMDKLQLYIKDGLKVASDNGAKSPLRSPEIPETSTAATIETIVLRPEAPGSIPIPTSISRSTTPLAGSWSRHSVGIFSTSPAKTPFTNPTRSPIPQPLLAESPNHRLKKSVAVENPADHLRTPKIHAPSAQIPQLSKPTLVSVSDDPLWVPEPAPEHTPEKPKAGSATNHRSLAVTSSLSSTNKKMPTDSSNSRSCSSDAIGSKSPQEQQAVKAPVTSHQKRRVPRGLFTSTLNPSSEQTDNFPKDAGSTNQGSYLDSHRVLREPSLISANSINHTPAISRDADTVRSSGSPTGGPPSQTSSSRPQSPISPRSPHSPHSPHSPLTSVYSSPSTPGLKSPTSPSQQRGLKPSSIQTSLDNNTQIASSKGGPDEDDEMSQLAKDLEQAMNPTPTETSPKFYFLEGNGLLQRIPSQVSMDDGLLNDDDGDRSQSDESDSQRLQGEGSNLSRGRGSLRRQRSGGKRRFKLIRSRSRNRSKSRQEKNKSTLTPIEVGYPSTLVSSDWPFESSLRVSSESNAEGNGESSSTRPVSGRPQRSHDLDFPAKMQKWEPRAGPRLPFAESVTIANPTRVGKGIGSFTIYSITLILCKPAESGPHPILQDFSSNQIDGDGSVGSQEPMHGQQAHRDSQSQISSMLETPSFLKSPTKAALMITRSFSSPEINASAQRLYMSMNFPEDIHHHSSNAVVSGSSVRISESRTEINIPSPSEPGRMIHVKKRYTDFVALRAQLVELLKERSRSKGNERGHQLGRPGFGSNAVARTARVPGNHSQHSRAQSSGDAFVDEDEDEDEDEDGIHSGLHSRATSSASIVSNASISFTNILRGMPKLPPKKLMGKFRPAFIEKRRRELEYFLEWVVAHPVISDSPVVVRWFLGDQV